MIVQELTLTEIDNHPECESERQAIINRLGLTGQTLTPGIRWPVLDRPTMNIYKAICPVVTPLGDYALDPIPLRVLELAELAKPHFDRLVVWHPASGAATDPVLVGERKFGLTVAHHAIARWGESLDERPAMVKVAAHAIRAEIKKHAHDSIASAQRNIEMCKSLGDEELIQAYRGFSFSPF